MFLLENFDIVLAKTESGKDAAVLVLEQEDLPAIGKPIEIVGGRILAKCYFDIIFSNETICRLQIAQDVYESIEAETLWVCATDLGHIVFEQEVPFKKI